MKESVLNWLIDLFIWLIHFFYDVWELIIQNWN